MFLSGAVIAGVTGRTLGGAAGGVAFLTPSITEAAVKSGCRLNVPAAGLAHYTTRPTPPRTHQVTISITIAINSETSTISHRPNTICHPGNTIRQGTYAVNFLSLLLLLLLLILLCLLLLLLLLLYLLLFLFLLLPSFVTAMLFFFSFTSSSSSSSSSTFSSSRGSCVPTRDAERGNHVLRLS
ncbi:hypothetical protein E2C01_057399 [Portunus trituberculatus]|uniref:Uncharacterized protein n=1 Tax=Portunus trituberculatus TaxID=210409 RepID=A0A5B7GWP2_PORTR|nr:hypothetical protein [Portunus trituberculatus]